MGKRGLFYDSKMHYLMHFLSDTFHELRVTVGTVWVNEGKGRVEGSLVSIRYFSHCYVLFMCNDKNLNMRQIIHFIMLSLKVQ